MPIRLVSSASPNRPWAAAWIYQGGQTHVALSGAHPLVGDRHWLGVRAECPSTVTTHGPFCQRSTDGNESTQLETCWICLFHPFSSSPFRCHRPVSSAHHLASGFPSVPPAHQARSCLAATAPAVSCAQDAVSTDAIAHYCPGTGSWHLLREAFPERPV